MREVEVEGGIGWDKKDIMNGKYGFGYGSSYENIIKGDKRREEKL